VDNTQNIISFCTGYGGLELGIRRAGVDVRVICNVEIEAFVQANLVAKIEEGRMDNAPIYSDLKTFPAREFRGKIHGLIGGYPCQPFSSAGKRQGEKDPRHLWPYILKHVRAIRPVWCFWENVAGHTTMGLWRVLSDLEEEGYRCAWGIFSAEEVGAPHQRKRVFILGYSEGTGLPCGIVGQREEQLGGAGTWDGKVMGNPTSLRPHRGSENCEGEQSEVLGERLESDELGNTKHDGLSTTQDGRSACEEQEEGRMQKLEGGCKQSQDELANPTSRQPRQSQARNGGQDIGGGSEEELADSEGNDEQRCDTRQGQVQSWGSGTQSEELGNTTKQGSQDCGIQGEVASESEATSGERCESSPPFEHAMSAHHGGATQWPARPGEEQYEWEEPRVVVDSKKPRLQGCGEPHTEDGRECEKDGAEVFCGSTNTGTHERVPGGKEGTSKTQSQLGGAVDGLTHRVDRLRLLGNGVVPQTAELAWKTLWKEMNAMCHTRKSKKHG